MQGNVSRKGRWPRSSRITTASVQLYPIAGKSYTEEDAREIFPFDVLVEAGVIQPMEAAKVILEKRNAKRS